MSQGEEPKEEEVSLPVIKVNGVLRIAELYFQKYGNLTFGVATILILQLFFWAPMQEQTMRAIDAQRSLLEDQRLLFQQQEALFDKRESLLRRMEQTSEQLNRGLQTIDTLVNRLMQKN